MTSMNNSDKYLLDDSVFWDAVYNGFNTALTDKELLNLLDNNMDVIAFSPFEPRLNNIISKIFYWEAGAVRVATSDRKETSQLFSFRDVINSNLTSCLIKLPSDFLDKSFFVINKADQANPVLRKYEVAQNENNFIVFSPKEFSAYNSAFTEKDIINKLNIQYGVLKDNQYGLYYPVVLPFAEEQFKVIYVLYCRISLCVKDRNKFLSILIRLFQPIAMLLFIKTLNTERQYLKLAHCKSAIGSIMSRNGSHNIGSHVLSALSHNVGTMPDDRILYKYIQYRMDYVATVTTEFPSWTKPTMFVGDLMKDFFMQRHLLEYIAQSEGLSGYRFQDQNLIERVRRGQSKTIKIFIRKILPDINNEINWANAEKAKSNVFHFINYIDYGMDKSIPLENDVVVSIAGGVVGEHAFYTILENIIRNAAKHGWSRSWDDRLFNEKKPKNLEIYIDLLDNQKADCIEFTIWDNMSNVFAGISEEKKNENFVKSLPDSEVQEFIKTGKSSKDEPLHHRQQIELARSLITGDGTLRKENWGLAEMKISAGYLQKRSISVIGGFSDLDDEKIREKFKESSIANHIILPVAMPGTCKHSNNVGIRCFECKTLCKHNVDEVCLKRNKYHLGYRFFVPKPREILIVLSKDVMPDTKIRADFKKEGVYFALSNTTDFGFEYVVLSKNPKDVAYYPIRLLAGDITENDTVANIDYKKILHLIEKNENQEIKNEIYKSWLSHLREKCLSKREKEIIPNKKEIGIALDPYGTDAGGKGLITDYDLLKVIFLDCFYSMVRTYRDKHQGEQRKALKTFLDIRIDIKKYVVKYRKMKINANNIETYIKEILNSLFNDAKRQLIRSNNQDQSEIMSLFMENGVDQLAEYLYAAFGISEIFLRKYEERVVSLPRGYLAPRIPSPQIRSMTRKVMNYENINVCMGRNSPEVPIKYIRHFTPGEKELSLENAIYAEPLSGTLSYLNTLEHLFKSNEKNTALVTKMVENAFVRILVIDERMCNFLKSREELISTFSAMRIWTADTSNNEAIENPQNSFVEATISTGLLIAMGNRAKITLSDVKSIKEIQDGKEVETWKIEKKELPKDKFDILIIHQGLIDKWLPESLRNSIGVGVYLTWLQQSFSYVIVTTGRGKPANIPVNTKILPFSSIESCLFKKYPEKMILVDSIMNILPGGK